MVNNIKSITDINDEEYEVYLKVKRELKNKKHLQIKNKLKRSIPTFVFYLTLVMTLVFCNIAGTKINEIQYWIICSGMIIAYILGIKVSFNKV